MSDTLLIGSNGEAVKLLQKALNYELGMSLVVDGGFGNGTANALKTWQTKVGLKATGVYGPEEWVKLEPLIETKFLSNRLIDGLAPTIGVKPSVVKAFIQVEAGGSGFFNNKKPVILFERHVFYAEVAKARGDGVAKAFQARDASICHPKWDKSVYLGGTREYDRLDKAMQFDETCALKAASWGMFQIMGNNHAYCGYSGVQAYVRDMYVSETIQFKALLQFMVNYPVKLKRNGKNLLQALKDLDFESIAEIYNGSGYAANDYHNKLRKAELGNR